MFNFSFCVFKIFQSYIINIVKGNRYFENKTKGVRMSGELTELKFYTVPQKTVLGLLFSGQKVFINNMHFQTLQRI